MQRLNRAQLTEKLEDTRSKPVLGSFGENAILTAMRGGVLLDSHCMSAVLDLAEQAEKEIPMTSTSVDWAVEQKFVCPSSPQALRSRITMLQCFVLGNS